MQTGGQRERALRRLRLRAGVDYALRTVNLYAALVGGGHTRALVFLAAAQSATQHVPDGAVSPDMLEAGFLPDALRRPVSLSSLARSLGLSIETTRRHVRALEAGGFLDRTPSGGVLVSRARLDRPDVQAAVEQNEAGLTLLMRRLDVQRARRRSPQSQQS